MGEATALGLDDVWNSELWNPSSTVMMAMPGTLKCTTVEV